MSERKSVPEPSRLAESRAEEPSDAPPTDEEIAASGRLRDALERGDASDPLVASLQAAWSPGPIDALVHAALIADLPTAEELALAEELREELASGRTPALVTALHAAWSPPALDPAAHALIVDRALETRAPVASTNVVSLDARKDRHALARGAPARSNRGFLVTATTVLAFAASVIVWITSSMGSEVPLAQARSTQPLFGEPFKPGETSARIDRIVVARGADYRDNRFAKWGVK